MSASKYLAAARKLEKATPNWGDLSVEQQAWELAKVAMNGQNPTLSALALRAQTIKEAILSGELEVYEVPPTGAVPDGEAESDIEMERRLS